MTKHNFFLHLQASSPRLAFRPFVFHPAFDLLLFVLLPPIVRRRDPQPLLPVPNPDACAAAGIRRIAHGGGGGAVQEGAAVSAAGL